LQGSRSPESWPPLCVGARVPDSHRSTIPQTACTLGPGRPEPSRIWADNGRVNTPHPHAAVGQAETRPDAPLSREARVLVLCGLVVLFVGLFIAVFSDNRLSLFLGIAIAVTGALMSLPHMVAAAVSRR
jgi:hypothetical protein